MAWASVALPWLLLLGVALLLAVALCYWPLRIDVSGRARGEPDGAWVVAGGMSVAGLAFAFVAARGVKARLTVTLWGRKLALTPEWGKKLAPSVPKRVKVASRRAWARIDPLDLGLKLLDERRHLRLRYLVLDASYGFRDPLLTGRLVGALSMLSAVLPSPIEIRHRPRWDFEDGWEISLDGRAQLRPLLVVLELAVHVLRNLSAHRASPPVALAAPGPSELR